MAEQIKENCENCCDEFTPKFPNQKICYRCWKEQHPEKNIRARYKESLFGALGARFNRNRRMKPWLDGSDFAPTEETEGIWDKELIHDKNYIDKVTQTPANGKMGIVPELHGSEKNFLGSKSFAGKKMPDGAVFVGKFPLKEKLFLVRRGIAQKIVNGTPKPGLASIPITPWTGSATTIEHEKIEAFKAYAGSSG